MSDDGEAFGIDLINVDRKVIDVAYDYSYIKTFLPLSVKDQLDFVEWLPADIEVVNKLPRII